ncbi:MAG TPA: hypothetical protein VK970_11985 [Candidatus Methylacidiphilales bacterium]|nr:hypothetical protein [Candidatus Methylacidiphilales bacterium]
MKAYLLKVILMAASVVFLVGAVVFSFRAPIPAEHWIPQNIAIRKYINSRIHSPKIYITGGSSVMFGFDTGLIERELKRPTISFGINIGLRLEYLLDLARSQVNPGDVVVLALESNFYTDTEWTPWQTRNAIAWNYESLSKNTANETFSIYSKTLSSEIVKDIVYLPIEAVVNPSAITARTRTPESLIEEYEKNIAGRLPYAFKGYHPFLLDAHGDVLPLTEQLYKDKGMPWADPETIHPAAVTWLTQFIQDMKAKQVTVYFANFPYILDGQVADAKTQEREAYVRGVVKQMGSEFIDTREQLRFPREMIYDTMYHLNAMGRERRSRLFIECMRNRLPPPAAPGSAPVPPVSASPQP